MGRKILIERDLRELPAYSIAEAADYLRLPKSTLRAWLLGQRGFRSVIDIADRKGRQLSFINLVEAFVLSAIRRDHDIPLPKVRRALDYVRRTSKTPRPLADEQFVTDGVNLFVEKVGALVGVSEEGQLHLLEMIRDRLKNVRRDAKGIPEKIVLFPMRGAVDKGDIVIDPRLSFGRPVLDGVGVRTTMLAERFQTGDSIEELAREYSAAPEAIQNAIRCERRAA